MPGQPEFQQRLQSIERLLGEIEAAADPNLRASVRELVQLVMDLHGAGIERILDLVRVAGEGDDGLIRKLGRDELVANLLVLYGLHPQDLETRVAQAVEKARSRVRPHEGEVELLSVQDGAVRLRLKANGHGCGSTAQALKEIVENAVYQSAPDIASLVIEGGEEKQGFVSLDMLQGTARAPHVSNGLSPMAGEKGGL
jgi:Fe-S cluster biogenesis protein NfuA